MSYAKLRGRITEMCGTNAAFAKALEIDPSSLSAKLLNKSPWKREEIEKACEILKIPIEDVYKYFFTQKVGFSQHEVM